MVLSNVALKNAITFGEDRHIYYYVTDREKRPIETFLGWKVLWFLFENQSINGDIDYLKSQALLIKDSESILGNEIDLSHPNIIVVNIFDTDIVDLDRFRAKNYAHELWRVDDNNVRRMSYGRFPISN